MFFFVLAGCQAPNSGNQIAFSRLTDEYWQIWTMQPNGKGLQQHTCSTSDKRYPYWNRDNNKLYYRTNNNEAFILDLISSEENRIFSDLGMIGSIAVSPDGTQLLLVRFRTELRDSTDLWIVSINGKIRKRLTMDAGMQYDPCWSPDGNRIVYVSGTGYQANELYIMDTDGKNKKKLTDDKALELLPSFSPDGNKIAYTSDLSGNYDIWIMNADGTNPKQITHHPGSDTRPIWSQDGSQLVFVSDRGGRQQLWMMNINGNNARQLTFKSPSIDPVWKF